MYDRELVCSILKRIGDAIKTVQQRCEGINDAAFFTESPQGMEKLDAACMLLMAIGESIKTVDKLTQGHLLASYDTIDWPGVKGFRDIVAHHYFDIDAEQVFWILSRELEPLSETIQQMLYDMEHI
jgi:uncharacterized protein with HEPN domain